jgi:hypothetical protein
MENSREEPEKTKTRTAIGSSNHYWCTSTSEGNESSTLRRDQHYLFITTLSQSHDGINLTAINRLLLKENMDIYTREYYYPIKKNDVLLFTVT